MWSNVTRIWSWGVREPRASGVQGARAHRGHPTSAADIRKWSWWGLAPGRRVKTCQQARSPREYREYPRWSGGRPVTPSTPRGWASLFSASFKLSWLMIYWWTHLIWDTSLSLEPFSNSSTEGCGQIWSHRTSWKSTLTIWYWCWLDKLTVI